MSESAAEKIESPELRVASLDSLSRRQREAMVEAGEVILECYRVLRKGGINIVGECLKGQGTFYEFDHYPNGDVYDEETHAQYYYHAHRGLSGEHGHFHTFLRQGAIPESVQPVPYHGETKWPEGSDAVCHLVAISMDVYGFPIGLFSTNRWVTDEVWYAADDVIGMLDGFEIDHAYPSWPVNVWITSMFRLFRPEIEALIFHRDASIETWKAAHPDVDVFEDRNLEVTGQLRVSVKERLEQLNSSLT
ncbi:MAG TPA: hypothetical protein VLS27_13710 [Gammaproteobacteria bacterium]|nr:hypothetical protein [Gammaproteobacteria bacterium]